MEGGVAVVEMSVWDFIEEEVQNPNVQSSGCPSGRQLE